ncbi:hypothetical protein ACFW2V_13910 [Streptomyces sp. NPDC058947]|uniref:hypothetical protein n=1 Tax=Streptomyces sp. NPDC058947 TaxID=3346675 RepID=UPI0036B696EF
MRDAYESAPEDMLRANATSAIVFRQRVTAALEEAGVPQAETYWDHDEDEFRCTHSGYRYTSAVKENGKVVDIAVIGRTGVPDGVRQGERDALVQQTRAALKDAGIEVRVDEYGHLKAVNR